MQQQSTKEARRICQVGAQKAECNKNWALKSQQRSHKSRSCKKSETRKNVRETQEKDAKFNIKQANARCQMPDAKYQVFRDLLEKRGKKEIVKYLLKYNNNKSTYRGSIKTVSLSRVS